jgi:chemotaxis protein methyltransferase CheR
VLARAKKGVYTQFEVQRGLPIQHLVKYFKQDGNSYQLDDPIRSMVNYKEYNLLGDLKGLGTFDIVFCRNVLIYFDPETKAQVLERIAQQMPSDGLLFLGGAETVVGVTGKFKPVQGKRGVYAVQ